MAALSTKTCVVQSQFKWDVSPGRLLSAEHLTHVRLETPNTCEIVGGIWLT